MEDGGEISSNFINSVQDIEGIIRTKSFQILSSFLFYYKHFCTSDDPEFSSVNSYLDTKFPLHKLVPEHR